MNDEGTQFDSLVIVKSNVMLPAEQCFHFISLSLLYSLFIFLAESLTPWGLHQTPSQQRPGMSVCITCVMDKNKIPSSAFYKCSKPRRLAY
jgi:hypothetical protein